MTGTTDDEFAELWHRYHRRLVRYAWALAGPDEADEIAQETMFRCYARLADLDRDPWPWLIRVARNVATDRARTRLRRQAVEAAAPHDRDEPLRPDDALCVAETRRAVRRAVAALRPGDRAVIALHHFDGVPTAEIARRTGQSDTAVRQQLHRARNRLKVQYRRVAGAALVPLRLWWRNGWLAEVMSGAMPALVALNVGIPGLAGPVHAVPEPHPHRVYRERPELRDERPALPVPVVAGIQAQAVPDLLSASVAGASKEIWVLSSHSPMPTEPPLVDVRIGGRDVMLPRGTPDLTPSPRPVCGVDPAGC